MASCITSMIAGSVSPQVQLTVTEASHTDTTVTFNWTLSYVTHGYAASTNGAGRAWSVVIDGSTVQTGTYNINGLGGTTTRTIASGTKTVSKTTASRNVSFGLSFNFEITWSGVYAGEKTASGTYSIGAKTSYTVSYNANGGSGAPSNQTKWYGTTLTLSSTKPTRTGYTFSGWNTNSSGTGTNYSSGGSYTSNASITLYAKWILNTYTISYNANGGSGAPSNQTKTHGVSLALSSTKPTRTGYTFSGWNTNSSGTGTNYSAGGSYTSNASVTLYAKWTLNTYTVSYNANGGSGAPSNQTKTYGQPLTLSSTEPTRMNYKFMGWAASETGSVAYASGSSYTENAPITLYAIWELASEAPSISNFTISRKSLKDDVLVNDPLDGNIALVDFDYSFDQQAGTNYGQDIYYMISSKNQTVHLSESEYDFDSKASGHIQFQIENVTNLVDSILYLTVIDENGMSTSKEIRLYAGRYFIDYYDDPNGDVGVSIGMPASQDGFHVGPWAQFHKTVYMKPDQPETEADIYFETGPGGDYEHKACLYGADSDSYSAIGLWDSKNDRRILSYDDVHRILWLGSSDTGTIRIGRKQIAEGTDISTLLNTPGYYTCPANDTVVTLLGRPVGLQYAFDLDVVPVIGSITSSDATPTYMKAILRTYLGDEWVNFHTSNDGWIGWKRTKACNSTDAVYPHSIKLVRVSNIDSLSIFPQNEPYTLHIGYFDSDSSGTKPFSDGFLVTFVWRAYDPKYLRQLAFEDDFDTIYSRRWITSSATWSSWVSK